ncbi:hypothetical protein Ddye_008106 [Dipteronia dyeriana]|uniref:Uncharacterized protein n=1 Tax=Dipteronia dyeriana TaxID=168575 RepID=A0AAD9X8X9_9ROSI|nr:hypothetical protein Ddye_008106 [Dipteronia dyeriana]
MDTSESSGETSEEPDPMVDVPPEHGPRTRNPPLKRTNGSWFNFDDLAPRQWRKRMSEMSVLLDLQIAKDWYQALGEYRQLQLVRCGSVSLAMGIVFREFLRDASQLHKQTRQEFFEMRCCSLDKRDIDYHYRRMSFRYHELGGINDETLRQVYLNSLPTELQGELQRIIELSGKGLRDISLGEIGIQEGHYVKQCSNKRAKSAKLIQQLRQVVDEIPSDADIESIFSEQEDVNRLTSFMIQDSDDSSTPSESTGYTDPDSPSEAYQATDNGSSGPQVQIQVLTAKYSKSVPVIAYFDT